MHIGIISKLPVKFILLYKETDVLQNTLMAEETLGKEKNTKKKKWNIYFVTYFNFYNTQWSKKKGQDLQATFMEIF